MYYESKVRTDESNNSLYWSLINCYKTLSRTIFLTASRLYEYSSFAYHIYCDNLFYVYILHSYNQSLSIIRYITV